MANTNASQRAKAARNPFSGDKTLAAMKQRWSKMTPDQRKANVEMFREAAKGKPKGAAPKKAAPKAAAPSKPAAKPAAPKKPVAKPAAKAESKPAAPKKQGPRAGSRASSGNKSKKTPVKPCLLYTSPSPRDKRQSRMPSSA